MAIATAAVVAATPTREGRSLCRPDFIIVIVVVVNTVVVKVLWIPSLLIMMSDEC
jgi:hypothetical protein